MACSAHDRPGGASAALLAAAVTSAIWAAVAPGPAAAQQCDWSGVWQTQWGDAAT